MVTEISSYYDRPCRFRLKSGKEVFGVIWKDNAESEASHYFASSSEYLLYRKALEKRDLSLSEKFKVPLDIEEVIYAECLQ